MTHFRWQYQAFVEPIEPMLTPPAPVPDLSTWWRPAAEPVRAVPPLVPEQFTFPLLTDYAELIPMSKWWRPPSEPPVKAFPPLIQALWHFAPAETLVVPDTGATPSAFLPRLARVPGLGQGTVTVAGKTYPVSLPMDGRLRRLTDMVSDLINSLAAGGQLVQTGPVDYQVRTRAVTAGRTPTFNDGSAAGYAAGTVWVDTVLDAVHVCVDATQGAAVWVQMGAGAADLTVAAFAPAAVVTKAEGIASNDTDAALPTAAAVKDYVDNNAGGLTQAQVLARASLRG